MQYLAHFIFVCNYLQYVLIPHKCVIGEPRFFLNWCDTGAKYSCMYITEICLAWSFPHYEDCGWYLDKNTLGGESLKYGCDVFEFHYSSTYDVIHHAPTNVLKKSYFILKNFLTFFVPRSTIVKTKSEWVDVDPHEWTQWRTFVENVSIPHFVFSLCSYFHLDLIFFILIL